MRNLLKYLFPVLIIVAFCNVTGRHDAPVSDFSIPGSQIEESTLDTFITETGSDISTPRNVSLSGVSRHNTAVRRSNNAHSRSHSEFIKSGKTLNSSIIYSFQRYSVIVSTSVVAHACKLVYLGRLII